MFNMEGQRSHRVMLLGNGPEGTRTKAGMLISGGGVYIKYVENEEEFKSFWFGVDDVKNSDAKLNNLHQRGSLSENEYRTKLEEEWLNVIVRAFVRTYGKNCVPSDVRCAIDDVIEHLHRNVVADIIGEWPPLEYSGHDINGDVPNPDWVHFFIREFHM